MRNVRWCLVGVLLASASSVRAQAVNFWTQCTPGAFQACASVELWNEIDPVTDQLYLFVRVGNVQGTTGFDGLSPYAIASIVLNDATAEDPTPLVPSPNISGRTEAATRFGTLSGDTYLCPFTIGVDCAPNSSFRVGEFWKAAVTEDRAGAGFDNDIVRLSNDLRADNRFMIWGCTQPDRSLGDYWGPGTCGGFVTWRVHAAAGLGFRLTDDVSVNLGFEGYDPTGARIQAQCQTGVDCMMITPEPATLALVATGLAAIGALRRRRRQRGSGLPA